MQRARSSTRALESSQLVVTSRAMSSISTSDDDGGGLLAAAATLSRARLRFKRNHVAAYRSMAADWLATRLIVATMAREPGSVNSCGYSFMSSIHECGRRLFATTLVIVVGDVLRDV